MVISNTWSNPVWSRFCPRLLMTLLRGSNQGGKRCSFQSYSASHITWTAEARFIARPLSALVQTIYGSVGHVNFLHLGAFSLFYRMNELQNELYESKRDLRSRMNNLSGWKRTWKNSGLTGNQANCRASHFTFVIYLMVTNLQWPALQLAWLAQWIEHCVRPSQKSWFDSQSSLNFFRFSFNPLGCSFCRKDHVHFHFFIRSSKIDPFHIFQFRINYIKNIWDSAFVIFGIIWVKVSVISHSRY